MRSSAAPTATVLVVVTLVFAPILKHNRWITMLVGGSTTKVEVQCDSKAKCPPVAAIVAANAKAVQQAIADYLARSGR